MAARAKKKAAPAGDTPRLDDPDDAEALAVYADWLQSKGDPRGELIALQQKRLEGQANVFLATHRQELLGPFAGVDEKVVSIGWQNGFPRWISMSWSADAPGRDAMDLLARLRDLPESRFVRNVQISGAAIDRLIPVELPGLEQLQVDNCTIREIDPAAWDAGPESYEVRFQYCEMDLDALFERILFHGPGHWKVSVFEMGEEGYRQTPRFKDVQALGGDFAGDRQARTELYLLWGGWLGSDTTLPATAGPRQLRYLNHSKKALRARVLGWLEKTWPPADLPAKGAKLLVLGKPVYLNAAELAALIKKSGHSVVKSAKDATHALVLDAPGDALDAAIAAKLPVILEAQLRAGAGAPEAPSEEEAGGLEAKLLSADVGEVRAAMKELRAKAIPKALLPAALAVAFFHGDAAVRKDGRTALMARADPATVKWLQTNKTNTAAIKDGAKLWKLTREVKDALGVDPMLFSRHMVRVFSRREEELYHTDDPLSVALRFPENEAHVFRYYEACEELTLPDLKKSFPKGLGALKSLVRLRVRGGTVTSAANVAELATLPKLRRLEYWVKKADLKHLAALADLVCEIDFRGAWSELSDISPLKSWTKLESVTLSNTAVSDLTPLAGKATIKSLFVADTPLADLAPLTTLPALETLSIEKVKAGLAPLAKLTGLKYLHAGFTALEDLALLSGMKSLQQLNLWGVKVKDLSPLASLPLTSLSLTYVQPLPDLTPLASIATLRSLDLVGCNADPETVLALKKKLPDLYVSG